MGMQISSAEASWNACAVSEICGSGSKDPGLEVGVGRLSGMVDDRGRAYKC